MASNSPTGSEDLRAFSGTHIMRRLTVCLFALFASLTLHFSFVRSSTDSLDSDSLVVLRTCSSNTPAAAHVGHWTAVAHLGTWRTAHACRVHPEPELALVPPAHARAWSARPQLAIPDTMPLANRESRGFASDSSPSPSPTSPHRSWRDPIVPRARPSSYIDICMHIDAPGRRHISVRPEQRCALACTVTRRRQK